MVRKYVQLPTCDASCVDAVLTQGASQLIYLWSGFHDETLFEESLFVTLSVEAKGKEADPYFPGKDTFAREAHTKH